MYYTDNLHLPVPEGGDEITPLQDRFRELAEAVDLHFGDTGWIDLDYLPGFGSQTAGQLGFRVHHGVVYLRGGASGDFPANAYTDVLDSPLPLEVRPSQTLRTSQMGSGMKGYCGLEINSNSGQIKLGWSNGGSANLNPPAWISAGFSWPLDD